MKRKFVLGILLSATVCAYGQTAHVTSVNPTTAGLNDTIDVTLDNLTSVAPADAGKQPAVAPFLNGNELKGSTLEYVDRSTNTIRFTLKRDNSDAASRQAWSGLLRASSTSKRKMNLSVGAVNGPPLPYKDSSKPVTLDLIVFRSFWTLIATTLLALLLVAFLVLACTTDILKDPATSSANRTYSLGRSQMAWWTFIVMGSFIFIWLVTGDLAFPQSSLVLLGISSATALGAVLINPVPLKAFPLTANTDGKAADPGYGIRKFFRDILNDGSGPSFHRFQIFAWTLVLGTVFVAKVCSDLAQPTLDPTLLALMGISSATYIGFKFQEKSTT